MRAGLPCGRAGQPRPAGGPGPGRSPSGKEDRASRPWLPETDLTHAILEIVGTAQDFNLNAHEENREIAAIDFRESDRVLLSGDNGLRLAFFAAVNRVKDLLLRKPMVVGEPLGIDEIGL